MSERPRSLTSLNTNLKPDRRASRLDITTNIYTRHGVSPATSFIRRLQLSIRLLSRHSNLTVIRVNNRSKKFHHIISPESSRLTISTQNSQSELINYSSCFIELLQQSKKHKIYNPLSKDYIIQFFFSQLISLMKSLHLLVEKQKYQYLILASLILAACYRYIVLVVLVQYN